MVKFKSKTRVQLTQPIDRHTTDGNSRYLRPGDVGTVHSRIIDGKRIYGVEFDRVRDDPWNAGLAVTETNVKTLDGLLHDVIDLCEAVDDDDAMGMPGNQWRGFIGADDPIPE